MWVLVSIRVTLVNILSDVEWIYTFILFDVFVLCKLFFSSGCESKMYIKCCTMPTSTHNCPPLSTIVFQFVYFTTDTVTSGLQGTLQIHGDQRYIWFVWRKWKYNWVQWRLVYSGGQFGYQVNSGRPVWREQIKSYVSKA